MEKKEYISPIMEAYEVIKADVICTSPPPYSGPLGVKEYTRSQYDDTDDEW